MRATIATGGLSPRETGAAALNGSQGGRSALFALRCPIDGVPIPRYVS